MKTIVRVLGLLLILVGLVGCQLLEPGRVVNAAETAVTNATTSDPLQKKAFTLLRQNDAEQQAIDLLVAIEDVTLHLANYPDWTAEAYLEDEENGIWYIDLYSEQADEWLGYGNVDVPNAEVLDYFVPRELTPEAFQHGLALVENFVLNDPEVLALLGDLSLWGRETYYDRWETAWNSYFWRGLDEWVVITYLNEDDSVYLDGIIDQNAFDEQEQALVNRDQAIEIAYEADGLWEALEVYDDWRTYVEHQGDTRYSVEFVGGGEELFYVLVDIETWEILESR